MSTPAPGYRLPISTMPSASGNGSGRSSTWWTTENSAVFAPMHIASVSVAVTVNAVSFQSRRRPRRRSENIWAFDGIVVGGFRVSGGVYGGAGPFRPALLAALKGPLHIEPVQLASLGPQRDARIDAGGAPGGHEVGQRRDGQDDDGGGNPRQRVAGGDAVQRARNGQRGGDGEDAARAETCHRHDESLPHHVAENRRRPRAERDPDADPARPPRDRTGDYAGQTDRGKQHRDAADRGDEPRTRACGKQRRRDLGGHGLVLEEHDVRLEREELAPHVAQQRRRVAARARDDRAVR